MTIMLSTYRWWDWCLWVRSKLNGKIPEGTCKQTYHNKVTKREVLRWSMNKVNQLSTWFLAIPYLRSTLMFQYYIWLCLQPKHENIYNAIAENYEISSTYLPLDILLIKKIFVWAMLYYCFCNITVFSNCNHQGTKTKHKCFNIDITNNFSL